MSKGLKVNLGKTKVVVSGTEGEVSVGKVDPCGICEKRVMVYWSCVRSAMLNGSETCCLRENEMEISRRTERAMVRAMSGAKLMEKKRTEDLMEMFGLKETVARMAKVNEARWYGHVLRRDDGHVLRKALEFEVKGKRKLG